MPLLFCLRYIYSTLVIHDLTWPRALLQSPFACPRETPLIVSTRHPHFPTFTWFITISSAAGSWDVKSRVTYDSPDPCVQPGRSSSNLFRSGVKDTRQQIFWPKSEHRFLKGIKSINDVSQMSTLCNIFVPLRISTRQVFAILHFGQVKCFLIVSNGTGFNVTFTSVWWCLENGSGAEMQSRCIQRCNRSFIEKLFTSFFFFFNVLWERRDSWVLWMLFAKGVQEELKKREVEMRESSTSSRHSIWYLFILSTYRRTNELFVP